MSGQKIGKFIVAAGVLLAVAGCQEGAGPFAQKAPAATAEAEGAAADAGTGIEPGGALSLVARDVEAPDVFSVTDAGLWDGRPSLGGVWVAHSDVKDPERVIIRNTKNGKSVIGALFRREAANPGPSVQISSDAAAALEILAGAPTEVSVVALRREEPAAPAASAPAADTAEAAEGTDDIAQTAAAAIDEAEGIAPAAAPSQVATDDTGAPLPEAAADAAATAEAPAAPAKRKGLFGGLFGRKAQQPAEPAPAETAAADTAAAAPVAGAPIASGTIGAKPLPDAKVTAAAPAAPSAPAAPAPTTGLDRAYVQIGIFSVEANAKRAADQMKSAGMSATVKSDASNGKSFWRVIVGPAASVAEREALAGRVKGLGYPDAYPVKG